VPQLCKYDPCKHFFFLNRLVKLWNSLPDVVLVVLRDIKICSGMVFVCIMVTNPSSSTRSQCKNSISLVFC